MSKTYNTIVVGVAFSPNLHANLFEALRLTSFFEAHLVLVHVGKESPEKKELLNTLIQSFPSKVPSHEVVWQLGKPVEVLQKVCDTHQADLLMIGALQREGILQYYVGSIARKLTRQAACSVLLLIKPSIERVACQHIVVNGLENPKTPLAIKTAFGVAKCLSAKKLTIVEEVPEQEVAAKADDDYGLRKVSVHKERLRRREEMRVKALIGKLPQELTQQLTVATQPIFGRRGYSIGHYARIVRADLLVMNAPEKGSLWDRLFPHDLEHILSELPTDVLIVR